jgi:hypothetical protein
MAQVSETRTLLVILGVIAALGCGCLCVPLGLLAVGLGLPVAAQVQKAADQVTFKMPPPGEVAVEPAPLPNVPNMPRFGIEPPLAAPPPISLPPAPAIPRPPNFGPPPGMQLPPQSKPNSDPPKTGLAALSEQQKKNIYFTASVQRSILESRERMRETLRSQGQSTSNLDRMIDNSKQVMEMQLDSLCQRNHITRADLKQILGEGDAQSWPGARRQK